MTSRGIIRSGQTGKSEVRNCWTARSLTALHSRPAIKRPEKPVTGFSCVMGRFPRVSPWKAPVASFTPIPCQSRERSELNVTKKTATQVSDGRRRKEYSAICPSLRGCYLILSCLKVCFLEEQTLFATSFYHIEQLTLAVSYPQGWDLFFFIFFILSLF